MCTHPGHSESRVHIHTGRNRRTPNSRTTAAVICLCEWQKSRLCIRATRIIHHTLLVFMRAYVHTHTCTHPYTHMRVHTCPHTCIPRCTHTHTYTSPEAHPHTYIHTYVHACPHQPHSLRPKSSLVQFAGPCQVMWSRVKRSPHTHHKAVPITHHTHTYIHICVRLCVNPNARTDVHTCTINTTYISIS